MAHTRLDVNLKQHIQYPPSGIYSRVLVKSDKANYTLMCLAAGTDIESHTSAKNGVVYVLEGEGIFRLDGKDIRMEPGVLISMPAGAPHALQAEENTTILLCLTAG